MGERPLVCVQVMPLREPEIASNATAGLPARKYEGNLRPPARNCAVGRAGSKEAARRKSRRETELGLNFGFLRFGNSGLLLRSRSWGFGGGFLFERHLALGIGPAAGAGVGSG